MSRAEDDWEQEQPRRRMDRWGEEEPERRYGQEAGPERSGVVTTAGVITLILGSTVLLIGLCGTGLMFIAVADELDRGRGGPEIIFGLLIGFFVLLWSGAAIAAGFGLLNRRHWGRVLALILGGFGALIGIALLVIAVVLWFVPHSPREVGGVIVGYLIVLFLGLLFLAYSLWIFLVLLNARYAQEFR